MIGDDGKVPVRRFPIPSFVDGRIFVTFPDGRVEEIDRLAAGTQADLWWSVIRAAALTPKPSS